MLCPCGADISHLLAGDQAKHSEWLRKWPDSTPVPSAGVLAAVMADLADIDIGRVKGGRTYRATALWLAGVIDKRGSEDGPSVTAKLADQLTKVMQLLTREGGEEEPDGFREFSGAVSTPQVGARS
jgi:hypothetical protein